MPKIKRITRKELRKNELFEAIQKIIFYIKKNPKKIKIGGAVIGGVLLVLLIGNFLIQRAINTPKEELAQNIFSYHYSQQTGAQPLTSKEQFLKFLSKHKKGKLSDIALLYKGVLEKELKDYGTASKTFGLLLKNKNNIISSPSLMNLANIEEEKGNYTKAKEYYKMLLVRDDYLKEYAKERISKLNKISSIETLTTEIGTSSALP